MTIVDLVMLLFRDPYFVMIIIGVLIVLFAKFFLEK